MENGRIYSTLIDPVLKPLRGKVACYINKGEKVIDIACGTGALAFELAGKAGRVVGVYYSMSMLAAVKKNHHINEFGNIDFLLAKATNLNGLTYYSFRFAETIFNPYLP